MTPYQIVNLKKKMADGLLAKPFTIVASQRSWGLQHVLRDAQGYSGGFLHLNGDSKQRRQQKRALLRELNQ